MAEQEYEKESHQRLLVSSLANVAKVPYSASVNEWVTVAYLFANQVTGVLPKKMTKPVVERQLINGILGLICVCKCRESKWARAKDSPRQNLLKILLAAIKWYWVDWFMNWHVWWTAKERSGLVKVRWLKLRKINRYLYAFCISSFKTKCQVVGWLNVWTMLLGSV